MVLDTFREFDPLESRNAEQQSPLDARPESHHREGTTAARAEKLHLHDTLRREVHKGDIPAVELKVGTERLQLLDDARALASALGSDGTRATP